MPVQEQILSSECFEWSVKRESVERGPCSDALTLYAPTLYAPDARQSRFVRIPPKPPKLHLRDP
jgi:hypothetical protein